MSAATTQQSPMVPPRPPRSPVKDSMPKIPPRPINRRIDRSLSPNPERFAPSPLNESPFPPRSTGSSHLTTAIGDDTTDRSKSVDMPTVGEEGREYELLKDESNTLPDQHAAPEQTRTVGEDVKLHAPRPSLPAQSAKRQVMAVTRTDSDKAASFGIGKPSSQEHHVSSSASSLRKKASTASQLSTTEDYAEDEHGIPEIGRQVPMYPDAGDVQMPSPAPGSAAAAAAAAAAGTADGRRSRNHTRKTSSQGLPPGSYGLHGHGVAPQDSLEKAYYEKHPELLKKERNTHRHDRPHDFSMSSEDLNKIVRDTASRRPASASNGQTSTPSEQVGWQVIEEIPHIASTHTGTSSKAPSHDGAQETAATSSSDLGERRASEEGGLIHVDEPSRRRSVMFSDHETPHDDTDELEYGTPILAEDETRKHPSPYDHPAVEPPPSVYEPEDGTSRPSSRATSRPSSLYRVSSHQSTPLEDVEEYEPLFPDEDKTTTKAATTEPKTKTKQSHKPRFPSRDIWEDAPDSVYYTTNVSTPDVSDVPSTSKQAISPPPRDGETPAQAFARHQEELAETETREYGVDSFLPMKNKQKPIWAQQQTHLAPEMARPAPTRRFPSRDVWEDAPDSLQLETTVSTPQRDVDAESPADTAKPGTPQRPTNKATDVPPVSERPAAPQGPEPKQAPSDAGFTSPPPAPQPTSKSPTVADKPKPQIPAKPVKAGPTSGGLEPAEAAAQPKKKPAIPARPVGSKIAAMQASFMNDLNKKLGLGPQALKRDEPAPEEEAAEPQEKAPLQDARKGRARGPQRRAPAKSPSAAPVPRGEEPAQAALSLSHPSTLYEIDPEAGEVSMGDSAAARVDVPAELRETAQAGLHQPREEAEGAREKQQVRDGAADRETGAGEAKQDEEAKRGEPPSDGQASGSAREPPAAPPKQEGEEAPVVQETKSLATNMAGEQVVDEQLKVDKEHDVVEPVAVEER